MQDRILRNIHSVEGNLAQKITDWAGSMLFAYFHVIWFALWIVVNQGMLEPYIYPFDVFPYGLLTMVVSLEAIFLATLIMIAQNRQVLLETYRELEELQEGREVKDIQYDLDDIKRALGYIQQKIGHAEKLKHNGNDRK